MTWTNAFDIGECTVEVYHVSSPTPPTYSGVLAKGASAPFTDGSYSLSMAVDADGVVTLANVGVQSVEDDMGVRVVPAYSLDAMNGTRVSAPSSAVAAASGSASANGINFVGFAFGDALVDLSAQFPSQIAARIGLGGPTAATPIIQFTPEFDIVPVIYAPDESLVVVGNSAANSITPVITSDSAPVTPTSLTILAQPMHGAASVSGAALLYTPAAGYIGADSFTYMATVNGTDSNVATVSVEVKTQYNCDCNDDYPTQTLALFRKYLMVRLGFAAMLAYPPPGMTELLNSFLIEAQALLYRRYDVFRLGRWFTWNMTPGVRFYDFAANADTCAKKMDPRRVNWVGISQGDNNWRPLHCGIEPTRYSSRPQSIPDSYEIRQCIEVWPAPADDTWQLRIKGDFGLQPFAADTDVNTIDIEAIQLLALANAKAHYGQPDAGNYMQQLTTLIGDLTAGSHHTRRYIPGREVLLPATPPKLVGS